MGEPRSSRRTPTQRLCDEDIDIGEDIDMLRIDPNSTAVVAQGAGGDAARIVGHHTLLERIGDALGLHRYCGGSDCRGADPGGDYCRRQRQHGRLR